MTEIVAGASVRSFDEFSISTDSFEVGTINGRSAYTLKEWARLVVPQLVNIAMTGTVIYLSVLCAGAVSLPLSFMIGAVAINGALQAGSIGHSWYLSHGKLPYTSCLGATLSPVAACEAGIFIGDVSTFGLPLSIFIGALTVSACAIMVLANYDEARYVRSQEEQSKAAPIPLGPMSS